MTHGHASEKKPVPPSLPEMLEHYVQRRADARAAGLVSATPIGAVMPFEAAPAQPVDASVAWREALAAARFFHLEIDAGFKQAPPDWPTLVESQEPATAVAFALGNFPQLVRDLRLLLEASDLPALQPRPGRPLPVESLAEWAEQTLREKHYPQALLALGALRLAWHFEEAAKLSRKHQAKIPAAWQAAWANEQAALAWHAGQTEEAAAQWRSLPESVPVLFNRGMSALFLGDSAAACSCLTRAVEQLAEESGWHHLGRLYLTLAEMRR